MAANSIPITNVDVLEVLVADGSGVALCVTAGEGEEIINGALKVN